MLTSDKKQIEFVLKFGEYARKMREQWRRDNPEIMDAYEDAKPRKMCNECGMKGIHKMDCGRNFSSQKNGVRITHVDTIHDLPW